jgi:ABC-type dipeptide/oligopeptide/nickel transport system permease subunit
MSDISAAISPISTDAATRKVRTHLWARLWRHTSARIGLLILVVYALVLIVGPIVFRNNPSANYNFQDVVNSLEPPSAQHWLGTDKLGRDEFVRLIFGGKYTVLIGISAVVVGMLIGVPLGAISGFFRGGTDLVIQRFIDMVLAFPHLLLALALVSALGPGVVNLTIAVALSSFPQFVRLVRASAMSISQQPYVEAARALGVSPWKVLFRHVLPNSMTPVIVQAPLQLGNAILTAAALGFLGLGVQQPTPEWGSMMGDARSLIFSNQALVTVPGLLIVGIILAFNLVGDGLRDVIDPRLRSRTRMRTRKQRPAATPAPAPALTEAA